MTTRQLVSATALIAMLILLGLSNNINIADDVITAEQTALDFVPSLSDEDPSPLSEDKTEPAVPFNLDVSEQGADRETADADHNAYDQKSDIVLGHVYTVAEGEDHYLPYANVHGSLLQDDKVITEFTTDENGAFTLKDIPVGEYILMAEHEGDDAFGSCEISIIYDMFREDPLVLFLNECGLARFPSDFNPDIPISENSVKYWDYVKCAKTESDVEKETKGEKKPDSESAAKTYACPENQVCYECCCDPCQYGISCCVGPGWGALGLLGLIGVIGPCPVTGF